MVDKKVVEKDSWIAVEYEGSADGKVFDSNYGGEPLAFQVGAGMVIKGFDKGVIGMSLNDEKTVTIKAKDAYGEKKKEVMVVPKSTFGNMKIPEKGKETEFMSNMGPLMLEVVKTDKDNVHVIVNHPLAGKDLTFKIKLKKFLTKKDIEEIEKQIHASCSGGCHTCSGCK